MRLTMPNGMRDTLHNQHTAAQPTHPQYNHQHFHTYYAGAVLATVDPPSAAAPSSLYVLPSVENDDSGARPLPVARVCTFADAAVVAAQEPGVGAGAAHTGVVQDGGGDQEGLKRKKKKKKEGRKRAAEQHEGDVGEHGVSDTPAEQGDGGDVHGNSEKKKKKKKRDKE